MRACMHICMRAERACVYAGDGWTGRTEDGEMGGFTCVRASVHVRATLPACV